MLPRKLFVVLVLLLLAGCSGISVETDEPARALPTGVERVLVAPDDAWARTDPEALDFLKRIVAKLRVRSAARDYGVAFELADPPEIDKLAPGKDAVWLVARCDYRPRALLRRGSRGADAVPEFDEEPHAPPTDAETAAVRAFSFSLHGWIKTPGGKDRAMRTLSRVALSGDASFDEALGNDDEVLWFQDTLSRIADAVLDHLPRRDDATIEEEPSVPVETETQSEK
jgi:hypothetical protein